MSGTLRAASALAVAVFLASCGSCGGGGAQTTTATVGPSGGSLSIDGIEITVPPGALEALTTLTLSRGTSTPPAPYSAASPVFQAGPEGLVFLRPVTVAIELGGSTQRHAVFSSALAGGGYQRLPTRAEAGRLVAQAIHFSAFFAGPIPTEPIAVSGRTDTVLAGAAPTAAPLSLDLDRSGAPDELLVFRGDSIEVLALGSGQVTTLSLSQLGVTVQRVLDAAVLPATGSSDAVLVLGGPETASGTAITRLAFITIDAAGPTPPERLRLSYERVSTRLTPGSLELVELASGPTLLGISGSSLVTLPLGEQATPVARDLQLNALAGLLVAADLDADGVPEIVVASEATGADSTVAVVSAEGTPRWQGQVTGRITGLFTGDVVPLDFNQDGAHDLAVSIEVDAMPAPAAAVVLLAGTGQAGLFASAVPAPVPLPPAAELSILEEWLVAVFKATIDGREQQAVALVTGTGVGAAEPIGPALEAAPAGITVADGDRDGMPELFRVTNESPPRVTSLSVDLAPSDAPVSVFIIGVGSVTSDDGAIACWSRDTTQLIPDGSVFARLPADAQLTASPGTGWKFVRWGRPTGTFSTPLEAPTTKILPGSKPQAYAAFFERSSTSDGGVTERYLPRRVAALRDPVRFSQPGYQLSRIALPVINDLGNVAFSGRIDNQPAMPVTVHDGIISHRADAGIEVLVHVGQVIDAGSPLTVAVLPAGFAWGRDDDRLVFQATLRRPNLPDGGGFPTFDALLQTRMSDGAPLTPEVLLEVGGSYQGITVTGITTYRLSRSGRVCVQILGERAMMRADGIIEIAPNGTLTAHVEGDAAPGLPAAAILSGANTLLDCADDGAVYFFAVRGASPGAEAVLAGLPPFPRSHWRGSALADQTSGAECDLSFWHTSARAEHQLPGLVSSPTHKAMVGRCMQTMPMVTEDWQGIWSFTGAFPTETLLARTAGSDGGNATSLNAGSVRLTGFVGTPHVMETGVLFAGLLDDGKAALIERTPGELLTTLVIDGMTEPGSDGGHHLMATAAVMPRFAASDTKHVAVLAVADGPMPHSTLFALDAVRVPRRVVAAGEPLVPGGSARVFGFTFVPNGPGSAAPPTCGINRHGQMVMGIDFSDGTGGLYFADVE